MQSELIAIGLLLAGAVSGATGLAFPLIAGPILLLQYPPPQAVLLTATCSILGQIFSIALLRRAIKFEIQWQMIIPGLLGVPLGTRLLILANTHVLQLGLGILLAISSLCLLIRRPVTAWCIRSRSLDSIVGFCGGTCGGLFGASAVVPSLWFCIQPLDRHSQRAVMQPYIIAMQLMSLSLLLMHGIQNSISLQGLIWWPPAVLGGVAIGTFIFRQITCEIYSHAVLFLTLLSGVALVIHR